jgi:CheY-like chemotaxis protein
MSEGSKILIIDDDEDFRISIRTLLTSRDYTVVEAETAKSGLEKIETEKPNLIILDIMMETIDAGYSLNQVVKFQKQFEEYKQIPILMVSSIPQDPLSRFPQADGQVDMILPDHYLAKPVDIPKFLELVTQLLKS